MPFFRRILSLAPVALVLALPAFAATPITGVVTNKTTNKPSAGDDVVLIRLQQGMQEATHTTTDARGHYKLDVPDDGVHLVRVTHQKATYFKPAPPGTQSVDLDVYDAAPKIEGVSVSVEEFHIEAADTELHIVEIMQVLNESSPKRTQFGPAGFDFYLPADARILRTGAVTEGGMPVQTPAVPVGDPGHYTFLFPVRPGETQFAVLYNVPYSKSLKLAPRLATPVKTLAIILPNSMKFTPGSSSPYAAGPASDRQTWMAQDIATTQQLDFTVSGTGSLPQQSDAQPGPGGPQSPQGQTPADANAGAGVDANGNPDTTKFGGGMGKPIDPDADHDPWSKYKWWILGGLALLMAAAAGVLLRRPSPSAAQPLPYTPVPAAGSPTNVQQALKEEFFALETDRLQKKISEEEYAAHKAALDAVLLRALSRGKDA